MNISNRLRIVASMATKGNIIADVGTDHGYVPIYLLKENISSKAYAMDVNKGPLERAREHIENEGLTDKIETILCDGMKGLEGKVVDTVIIAGMGGELVCKILDESPVIEQLKELILSPHSEVEKVRKKIYDMGFYIVDEVMVEEYGKYYNIIKAHKMEQGKEYVQYSSFDLLYSRKLFENKDETFGKYLDFMEEKYNKLIKLIKDNNQGETKRVEELNEELFACIEAKKKYRE